MNRVNIQGIRNRLNRAAPYALTIALAVGIGLVYFPDSAGANSVDINLSSLPRDLDGWVGRIDQQLSTESLKILEPTDYLYREYGVGNDALLLYITYFNTGNGALTHNPEKCWTAAGWTFLDKKEVRVWVVS